MPVRSFRTIERDGPCAARCMGKPALRPRSGPAAARAGSARDATRAASRCECCRCRECLAEPARAAAWPIYDRSTRAAAYFTRCEEMISPESWL